MEKSTMNNFSFCNEILFFSFLFCLFYFGYQFSTLPTTPSNCLLIPVPIVHIRVLGWHGGAGGNVADP